MAVMASSSQSKTRAGPLCFNISGATALRFTTQDSGAMLPFRIAIPPVAEYGSSTGRMTSGSRFLAYSMFSPTVFPVAVRQPRLMRFFFESSFMTA